MANAAGHLNGMLVDLCLRQRVKMLRFRNVGLVACPLASCKVWTEQQSIKLVFHPHRAALRAAVALQRERWGTLGVTLVVVTKGEVPWSQCHRALLAIQATEPNEPWVVWWARLRRQWVVMVTKEFA